ncbi:MAG: hypothetical protein MJA32_03030 [Proteobacteria bacterium]|nr:hypothetical protein [Pseudomonadota bacterium]
MNPQLKVFLYSDHPSDSLSLKGVSDYLKRYGFECEIRGDYLDFLGLSYDIISQAAEKLAGSIVEDISSDLYMLSRPSGAEIASEIHRLKNGQEQRGTLYDGYWVQRIFHKMLSMCTPEELNGDVLHIVFTGRLFGTFEDRRYHARVVLTGEPALVSTSGLVEAPAKPREYYFIKGGLIQSGKDLSVLDEMYKGRFVEYDDPKTTPIICSYALQAVLYHVSGKAFCDNENCCLYNSHWQEDVLRVQYEGKPCDDCLELLKL